MRTSVRTIGWLVLAAALLRPPSCPAADGTGMVAQAVLDAEDAQPADPRSTRPSEAPTDADDPPGDSADPDESAPQDDVAEAPDAEAQAPPSAEPETPETEAEGPEDTARAAEDQEPATGDQAPAGDAETPEEETDWRPEPSREDILIDADEVFYQAGATVAEGNVVVRYRDITITSDTAEIDEDGVWGQFHGNVKITRDERQTTAELIRFNFDTEEWEVLGARTTLEPQFFERGVAEPIYIRAETVSGTGEEREVDAFDGLATSCDKEEPHYGLLSEHIRAIGEDTIVLEKPRFQVLGRTLLKYPWDLVLSRRSPNNRFFPELGRNTVEGFYAKFAYLYLTNSNLNSFARLHLTEKRGIGYGADHYFRTGPHSGEASLFIEPDEGSLNSRIRHNWEISRRLNSNLNLSLQKNSGYSGATTSMSGNLNLRHRGERSTTSLGLDRSITDSTYSTSKRFGANLNHRQRIGAGASWDLRTTLRRSEYGGNRAPRETLEAKFQFDQRRDWFDWALAAEDEWYLESEDERSYGLSRLPEIVFNTDTRRLGDYELFGWVPFRTSIKAGRLVQYPDEEEISFATIENNFGGDRAPVANNLTLTTTADFDQSFYADGSARFTVGGSMNFNADFGSHLHGRLSHRAATVAGFSPLRRDYAGVYDDTSLSVVHQTRDHSRFELTGGFDYVDDRWRELRLRGWVTPSQRDRIELMSGYALEDSEWRPVQVRWTHSAPWRLYLALSTRYDLDESDLDNADLEFDWRVTDRWRLQGITTYSGYRSEFQDINLRVTRDLHCWVASLTYNEDMGEIRFNLGIKAFPSEERDWTLSGSGARRGSYQQYYY